jgi:uncharacterized protein VirK/YbjX
MEDQKEKSANQVMTREFGVMEVYLEQDDHPPTYLGRVKLIAKSFIALMRYSYMKDGFRGVFKDIVVTIAHLDIVFMMTRADIRILLGYYPDLLNGSISDPYLATSFNSSRRARCRIFTFHYSYMATRLNDRFYEKVAGSSLPLWSAVIQNELFSICIQFEKKYRHEGDLTLSFETNHCSIYELAFTIVPGYLVGCSAPQALLIGRVQGVKDRFEEIRRATKLCERLARGGSVSPTDTSSGANIPRDESGAGNPNVAPPYLLVTAAQAIAMALDIGIIVGVNSRVQLSSIENYQFDYDAFWKSCSATENSLNFYVIKASFAEREPSDQISSGHRSRKRLRRQLKSKIHECVRAGFAEKCLGA